MSRFIITATWDDVPHLTPDEKAELLASIPPYQRDARTRGIPQLGAGAVYPVPESDIIVPDFEIPEYFPRGYGLDVGWTRTAAVWGALDRDSGVMYLYSCYYRGEAEPVVHVEAIKRRGGWIHGRIDPAARGRSQVDGKKLIKLYHDLGLRLEIAPNAREAGIQEVWTMLSTGRLKVFQSLTPWFHEFRMYRRDEQGRIVKQADHLMDATRYLILSGVHWLRTKPKATEPEPYLIVEGGGGEASTGWMA